MEEPKYLKNEKLYIITYIKPFENELEKEAKID